MSSNNIISSGPGSILPKGPHSDDSSKAEKGKFQGLEVSNQTQSPDNVSLLNAAAANIASKIPVPQQTPLQNRASSQGAALAAADDDSTSSSSSSGDDDSKLDKDDDKKSKKKKKKHAIVAVRGVKKYEQERRRSFMNRLMLEAKRRRESGFPFLMQEILDFTEKELEQETGKKADITDVHELLVGANIELNNELETADEDSEDKDLQEDLKNSTQAAATDIYTAFGKEIRAGYNLGNIERIREFGDGNGLELYRAIALNQDKIPGIFEAIMKESGKPEDFEKMCDFFMEAVNIEITQANDTPYGPSMSIQRLKVAHTRFNDIRFVKNTYDDVLTFVQYIKKNYPIPPATQ